MKADTTYLPFTICDGYTRKAYIAPVPNLHGELRIEFRPMNHKARELIAEQIERFRERARESGSSTVEDQENLVYGMLNSRITKWSATKEDGSPLQKDETTISILHPNYIDRLYRIVCSRDGGDTDPMLAKSTAQTRKDIDQTVLAAIHGTSVQSEEEDADRKN